jgi:hypothetical protein
VGLSNAHTLAQLKAINNATGGVITLNDASVDLSGSAADVAAALTGISPYTGAVTLTTDHTLPELKAINNATNGAITLNNAGVALSGTAADIAAALNGITEYTGAVEFTSDHNLPAISD